MTDLYAVQAPLPGGTVTAFSDADGVVLAAGYGSPHEVAERLLTGPLAALTWAPDDADGPTAGGVTAGVAAAMAAYVDGDLGALDQVPVRQPGTVLMQAVWVALRGLEPGRPATYAELAGLAGAPRAIRAVASACARNRIAPFVPCHRVVRTGGGVGGYAYGIGAKEALLAHEAILADLAPASPNRTIRSGVSRAVARRQARKEE